MLVACNRRFRDLEAHAFREEGEEFEVTEARYEAINGAGYGQLVRIVQKPVEPDESPSETASEPQKGTRRTRRKTTKTEE